MKKSTTAKAFVMSVLALVLCLSMLVGTTFAWFTDSVTSGVNKIVAGNLDVELYNVKGDREIPVTAETNLFLENALWEPGHVEVVNLKIANVGTLALTYKLGINKVRETPSVNVYGKSFKLSDYIMFALIEGNVNFGEGDTGRAAAIAAAEANSPAKLSTLVAPNEQGGVLYPEGKGTSEKYVTLVVYMPTDVDNKANRRMGEAIPTIDLGVKLEATQTPYENDSFNDQYDKNAKDDILTGTTAWFDAATYEGKTEYNVTNSSDLLALQRAVTEGYDFAGKTVTLTGDVDISAFENWAPIGSEERPFAGTFDGAGNTISGLKITDLNITGMDNGIGGFFGVIDGAEIKDLTVSGNITIGNTEAGLLSIGGICGATKGNATITGCENKVVIDLSAATGSKLVDGGIIAIGGILGNAEFGGGSSRTITITNCKNSVDLTADPYMASIVGGITATAYMGTYNFEGSVNNGNLTGMAAGTYLNGLVGTN